VSLMEEQMADAVITRLALPPVEPEPEAHVAEPEPNTAVPLQLPPPPPDAQPYQLLAHAMAQYILDHPGCMMHGPVARDAAGRDVLAQDATAVRFCMMGLAYHVADRVLRLQQSVWEEMSTKFAQWDYSMAGWYEGTPITASSHKRNTAETLGVLMLLTKGEPVPLDD